ncbi:MAG: hypothetical protein RJA22_2176 [Verrucomicrobiota bacterium]|jgi:hypothetical protein
MERPSSPSQGVRPGLLLLVVGIAAILVGVIVLRPLLAPPKPAESASTTSAAGPAEVASPDPAPARPGPRPMPSAQRPPPLTPRPVAPVTPPVAAPVPAETVADWGGKLDDVLGSAEPEAAKADRLLAIWPSLPADGQIEVMQHIANLLPDDRFGQLHNTFTNAQTREEVLDVIMTDALNRPNGIKLPALLDVARIEGHPKAAEAREILEVFVDENYGADWAKWEQAVQKFLKENPDEGEPLKPAGQ